MNDPRPIPDALLELYLLDELPSNAKADVEARLSASAAEQARLDDLRADSAAFFVSHPPASLAARVVPSKAPSRWAAWFSVALAGATAASLAFATLVSTPDEESYGIKGAPALIVHRQSEKGSTSVASGSTLKPGDTLAFEVRAPSHGFVAVLSRDGSGHVTAYFPTGSSDAAPYSPQAPVLHGAIKLDETPGAETAWLVFSTQPFALRPWIERLERTEALEKEGRFEVSSFTWQK